MSADYEEGLDAISRSRYNQKLAVIGCKCPYSFAHSLWVNNPHEWPFVEYADVFHYLVKTPGLYCREAKSDYKSLRAKTLLSSGFVQIVYHYKATDTAITIFTAEVIPSYRTTSAPHHPWVAVADSGYIVTAHCDCKAGLSESCTHVGGLLYKIEKTCTMGLTKPETCTDLPCSWNNVEWGGVKPAPLANIKFYSDSAKSTLAPKQDKGRKYPDVPISPEQKENFFIDLLASGVLPVGLSLFRSTAGNFVSTKPIPVQPRIPASLPDMVRACVHKAGSVLPTIRKPDLDMVEEMTREQSQSIIWHEQRTGRITSTAVHTILHTNPLNPSKSLISKITSSRPGQINTKALKWGRDNESVALRAYQLEMQHHLNFKCCPSGLVIDARDINLASSPDAMVECDCCGKGVVEVKCPFTLKDTDKSEWPGNKVIAVEANLTINVDHSHHLQMQHHMYVTQSDYCDYVIWGTKGVQITRVVRQSEYASIVVPKLQHFWTHHVKPELIHGTLQHASDMTEDEDKENQIYCICQKPGDGEPMVGCDNDKCSHQWFHWSCVGLRSAPRSKTWYCPTCRPHFKGKKRKHCGSIKTERI